MTPTEFIRSLHHATPEKALVGFFKVKAMSDEPKLVDLRLPFFDHKLDTVAYEMALPHGRADIVIFHLDGSTTVIEAKDGANGYTHAVGAEGQGQARAQGADVVIAWRSRDRRHDHRDLPEGWRHPARNGPRAHVPGRPDGSTP